LFKEALMGISVKVGPKYQVVIPSAIRKKVPLDPQEEVLVEELDGIIVIVPRPKSYAGWMMGLGKEAWGGVDPRHYVAAERDGWR
jgi:AbrB family looped-hinge helix DNA binding protein